MQRIPGGGISFVLARRQPRVSRATLVISEIDPVSRQTRALVRAPAGATEVDRAWAPDGLLLATIRGQLIAWRRGDREMSPVAGLDGLGLPSVTRLAISPKGDRIALVARNPDPRVAGPADRYTACT